MTGPDERTERDKAFDEWITWMATEYKPMHDPEAAVILSRLSPNVLRAIADEIERRTDDADRNARVEALDDLLAEMVAESGPPSEQEMAEAEAWASRVVAAAEAARHERQAEAIKGLARLNLDPDTHKIDYPDVAEDDQRQVQRAALTEILDQMEVEHGPVDEAEVGRTMERMGEHDDEGGQQELADATERITSILNGLPTDQRREVVDEVARRLSDDALLAEPDLILGLEQMRRGEGRVLVYGPHDEDDPERTGGSITLQEAADLVREDRDHGHPSDQVQEARPRENDRLNSSQATKTADPQTPDEGWRGHDE